MAGPAAAIMNNLAAQMTAGSGATAAGAGQATTTATGVVLEDENGTRPWLPSVPGSWLQGVRNFVVLGGGVERGWSTERPAEQLPEKVQGAGGFAVGPSGLVSTGDQSRPPRRTREGGYVHPAAAQSHGASPSLPANIDAGTPAGVAPPRDGANAAVSQAQVKYTEDDRDGNSHDRTNDPKYRKTGASRYSPLGPLGLNGIQFVATKE